MKQLSAKELRKNFSSRCVVDGVSLRLNQSEIVGLLGSNGAGKSTSFHMIIGLMSCDAGEIRLDGMDLTQLPIDQRARLGIGYLPQESSILRGLTVEDNLRAALEIRGIERARQQKQIEDVLAWLHIENLRHHKGYSLSGGERRRAEIARALILEPSFLLLDEPFAGIDPISVADIKTILARLRGRGIGILISDHNVRETLGCCDRSYIIHAGKMIAQGNTEEILQSALVRENYLGKHFSM